ncbi:MAG TPA: protein kinase [Acidobacteriota bacterium]|nr:protein kinase [Acidobacteriota bacterium]
MNPEQWERLKGLFSEALSRPADVRDSFVGKACGRDHELRAEVLRLLAAHERAGSYLSNPAVAVQSNAGESPDEVSSPAASLTPCLDTGTIVEDKFLVVGLIARGGMGEVYLAEDTLLNRTVAIKILTSPSSADETSRRRLIREAQSAARLDHPNICAIYEVVEKPSRSFIVMQLVEGETLSARIQRGPLALGEVLDIAVQVATALAVAHGKGIVHRDIKPQNIMLTPGGLVKVLDFGLAKLTQSAGADSPTDTLTQAGTIVGTVAYMSPEQAEGKAVDARSDIFSFGSVLYEMLTGRRAFNGDSKISMMAAILREEPEPIGRIFESVPQELERTILRCLRKNPGRRFQHIDDVKIALEEVYEETANRAQPSLQSAASMSPKNRWPIATLVLSILLVITASAAVRVLFVRPQLPDFRQLTFNREILRTSRFASDGRTIIYSAAWSHLGLKLYRSNVDGTDQRVLDVPAAALLAVSRLGEVAIISSGSSTLARFPLSGGAPRELLKNVIGADWSPDGTQLAVVRIVNGKYRLEFPVGKPLYETAGWFDSVRISPQGDAIAFMDHPIHTDDRGSVALVDLKGGKRALTQEWNGEEGLAWSTDGKEVWFTATDTEDWHRDLYAVTRSGKQRLVLRSPGSMRLEDIASNGSVLLRRDERRWEALVGQVGGEPRLLSWLQLQLLIAKSVSRDGKYAVISDMEKYGVYLTKLDGSPSVLLGGGTACGISPDNRWVASIQPRDLTKVLLLPTGAGETKVVTAPRFHYDDATWVSDGRKLVVHASESDRPLRYWIQDVDSGAPRPITPEGWNGSFVTVNHADYVCASDGAGSVRLFPVDGGKPKEVTGISQTDRVIGGSPRADVLYLTADLRSLPLKIFKLNLSTGQRQSFFEVLPTDATEVISIFPPIFAADDKRYVYTQFRLKSVLYLATGLE